MPRKHGEHDARLVLRLPRGMLEALKWTAQLDKLPLSDWVRGVLQARCHSLYTHADKWTEVLIDHESSRVLKTVATRPATGVGDLAWKGGRKDRTMALRSYVDVNGDKHLGSLPRDSAFDKDRQDLNLDRREARRELTTWLNRWGREGKTCRMDGKELRLAQRLLASFDDWDRYQY